MTSALRYPGPDATDPARRVVYAGLIGSVFMCSWLLFSLEPMSAKMLLPRLGGSPSVWITCLLFFQGALLAGYGYAHLSIRLLGLRRQAVLHAVLVIVSFAFLPVSLAGLEPPPETHPVVWLLGVLSRRIGFPFVILSSFGPIAQRWLAHADAGSRHNPYFLYAASNLGSLLALLAYPLIAEPLLTLGNQAALWSLLYGVVLALVILIAWTVWRMNLTGVDAERPAAISSTVTVSNRARWIIYAAVPSSLLMGATSFIATDVGSFPLIWVLPLSLYLLSFTLVFARRPVIPQLWIMRAQSQVIVLVVVTLYWGAALPGMLGVLLHLALLFLVSMVCHGELVRTRPEPRHLTEFYLWLATGGLLGGVFNALVAPLVFNEILEYPLAIVAAVLLRPGSRKNARADVVIPLLFGIALIAATWRPGAPPQLVPTLSMILFGVLLFSFREHPRRFALAAAIMFAIGTKRQNSMPSGRQVVKAERSFFGVYRILDDPAGGIRTLEHGTTLHGAQSVDSRNALEPLSYYHRRGPAGDIFAHTLPAQLPLRRVGLIGLGVGSLACYGRRGEEWVYYEIDPLVARIATDTSYFTMLRDCPPRTRIVFGDARLRLAAAASSSFDILVVDAFSSDAIPVHLLTREAFTEYLRVIKPQGVVAIHISSLHMDLEPLVAAIADDLGLVARVRYDMEGGSERSPVAHSASIWMALAKDPRAFGTLVRGSSWAAAANHREVKPWTDDYSNILAVIRWK